LSGYAGQEDSRLNNNFQTHSKIRHEKYPPKSIQKESLHISWKHIIIEKSKENAT
jgi:hypothetical protein